MPACTLHLLSLSVPIPAFLEQVHSTKLRPILVAKVIRWIITPELLSIDTLLRPRAPWQVFMVTEGQGNLPGPLLSLAKAYWSIVAGVPSRLTKDFTTRNESLLRPDIDAVPKLTGSLDAPLLADSNQKLELSGELLSFAKSFCNQGRAGKGAVSMLNLLAFNADMHDSYMTYGKAFADSIGAKRGGTAKIIGNVIDKKDGWDEIAVAHYPSIMHFADMAASNDYQEINQKYRVAALRDTCILMTSEIAIDDGIRVDSSQKPRL